jgi:hypothetical protein
MDTARDFSRSEQTWDRLARLGEDSGLGIDVKTT